MIEVKHLTKKYGNHVAVDDLSFQLEPGRIYGFLGPNGAGKSTTMNMMTGYLASTSGEVKINGQDILKEADEAKSCIGYLPEMPPLYDNMTVYEYLKFVAELKKIKKQERLEQIEQVMELTKITDMRNRLIQNLSKGYKQRVGIAQAVLGYPPIIILDEPTVGLDPKQIIEIRELIKDLGENHTVILSSHILTEISAVCDYVLILAHGKLVASDTPENLQGLFAGNSQLQVTCKGTKDSADAVIKQLSAIKKCEIQEEKGFCHICIETAANKDIREDVFYACAKEKLPIYEMVLSQVTLEDVFLELTESTADEAGKENDSKKKFSIKKAMSDGETSHREASDMIEAGVNEADMETSAQDLEVDEEEA